jgi:hypothetical protein
VSGITSLAATNQQVVAISYAKPEESKQLVVLVLVVNAK